MIHFDCEGCGRPIYLYGAATRPASELCGACHELNRCYLDGEHASLIPSLARRRGSRLRRMTLAEFLAIYDRICRPDGPLTCPKAD